MAEQEKTRYSDEELAEFKQLIEQKLVEERKKYEWYSAMCKNDGNETSDTSPTFMGIEDSSLTSQKDVNAQQAADTAKYIRSLEKALDRIANKTYGICSVTGKLIPKERLRCVPNTTMSVEGKKATQR